MAVRHGEIVAVAGPSGSGKSTLLHLLGGLDRPTDGEIHWGEDRIDHLNGEERAHLRARRLGFVFQHHYLLDDLSVLDNVALPALVLGFDARVRARELLEQVGLAARAELQPRALSGGERQRAALARALLLKPAVLLADEPTGSLDRANAQSVANLLVALARSEGAGVLLVTHDENLAGRADRVLHLLDGQMVDEAPALPSVVT